VIRMSLRFMVLCVFCSHSLGPSATLAQAPAATSPSASPAGEANTASGLRVVDLIAFDKNDRPVNDLKLEELQLFEDRAEQRIKSLSPAADEPLTIGLFFDVSGSRRNDTHVADETRLTSELVHSIWRQGDTAFLVGFGPRVIVVTQPTGKLEDIDEGLKQVPGGYWGSTAVYDALCSVRPELLAGTPGRKAYVVFSDFEDNSSRNRADCVLDVARRAGVAVFPVVLSGAFTGEQSKKAVRRSREQAQEFANESGGEVLIPESDKQLALVFQRLAADLQSAYRVTYVSSFPISQDKRKRGKLKLETTRAGVRLLYPKS
jgi:VWFA-related protein